MGGWEVSLGQMASRAMQSVKGTGCLDRAPPTAFWSLGIIQSVSGLGGKRTYMAQLEQLCLISYQHTLQTRCSWLPLTWLVLPVSSLPL